MTDEELRSRLRVSVAEYETHREKVAPEDDPDAGWWYAAWGASLLPVLKELASPAPHTR